MLGGHVTIGDFANIGLNSTIHQRRSVGPLTMVGMGSVVTRDLPGCIKAFGSPARAHGVNIVGMERQGFSAESIRKVVMDSDQDVSISPDESWPTHIAQSWEMFMSAVTEKTMQ
jgi:acyl-[acyl carrier protein]--UDP-N-acetylglucosamine O-acyltransferase